MSTGPDYARGAQTFSTILTVVGGAILALAIGYLTIGWWQEGQWFWVIFGIAVVLLNIAMIVVQLRRRRAERRQ